ncbi:MAG: cell division protein FtsQ/DivIB [Acidimicrobiales bacterium]
MDPRIRHRRVEVRRQEGRRRFRVLVGTTALVVAGAGGWAANGSSLLDLDRVVVVGAVRTGVDEARLTSGLRRGEPLSGVDPDAAARRVEALPWVQDASVSRRWPEEVRIRISEREPVAVASAADGRFAAVDGTGRVLEWSVAPPSGLPVLAGLPPAGPAGTTLAPEGVAALAVAVALPTELRARTVGVAPAEGGRGEVDIRLHPGAAGSSEGIVRLGPPEDLDRKFDAIRTVLAQVDIRNLAVLDVRRPDSPVLTRRETPTTVSTPRVG